MSKKKIVFVLVEGDSDRIALASLINKKFESDIVHVEVAMCDIFTKATSNAINIQNTIAAFIKNYLKANKYEKEDILQVIQITDMDGIYVDDSKVVYQQNTIDPIYCDDCIKTCEVDSLIHRNEKKRVLLNKMSTCDSVYNGIPYKIYYMSCNLDHVLYDKRNSKSRNKKQDAKRFQLEYDDKYDEFVELLNKYSGNKNYSYKESWDFIKKDCNSLNRYNNLNIVFKK